MQIYFPMFADWKVLQLQNILSVLHMHISVYMYKVFKWNYEQHLHGHTFIPTDVRFSRTNSYIFKAEALRL